MLFPAWLHRLRLGWLAGRELGLPQLAWYGLYRLGLACSYFRRALPDLPPSGPAEAASRFQPLFALPTPAALDACLDVQARRALLTEADEIVGGQVRLFGGPPAPLALAVPGPLRPWMEAERGPDPHADIKFTWEPARFGWVYPLGRAYILSGDERYPQAFWQQVEVFLDANPPYRGPHWSSAQEAALRLIAFTFGLQVFAASSHTTPERAAGLARAIAYHAARIPPTLAYARAQNNNHLLSEAAGLYTAGLALPDHPQAGRWRKIGWRVFNQGLQAQISLQGAYAQHSANYHRLMLQLAVWMDALARQAGQTWPAHSRARLAAAAGWLLALLDPQSGGVPNLGPNDGAYIFPLAGLPFADYRPALQAAGRAFLGAAPFAPGAWDEAGLWFGLGPTRFEAGSSPHTPARPSKAVSRLLLDPQILRSGDGHSWAYLRAARFTGRPGHADQLHLDLWWRGLNVAQDAGTYRYTAPPPWDNALRTAEAHNTVTVNGEDQMLAAGRFLYLRRARAAVFRRDPDRPGENAGESLVAAQDGYRHLHIRHVREVCALERNWKIVDGLYRYRPLLSLGGGAELQAPFTASLHWRLPDWPFEVLTSADEQAFTLHLDSPLGLLQLALASDAPASLQIVRAGEQVFGPGPVSPTWGWSSPTYGVKIPALSVRLTQTGPAALRFQTDWIFPTAPEG